MAVRLVWAVRDVAAAARAVSSRRLRSDGPVRVRG